MNKKIQLLVYVPKLNEKFDILVPENKELNEVVLLIEECVKKTSNSAFNDQNCHLYSCNNLIEYNYELTIKQNELENGSLVILY